MDDLFLLCCTVRCTLWAVWLCYCVYSKHSSPYSSLFGWGVGVGSSMHWQVSCSVFYPLVYQTYKAANCGVGKWAADLLQKTKLFRTQLCTKPCYVRAMEICSTFSCCKHCKLVAWGGIEPPTQGFSVQATAYVSTGLTQRILTVFWLPLTCAVTLTEPAAELFWSGRVYGHSVFPM